MALIERQSYENEFEDFPEVIVAFGARRKHVFAPTRAVRRQIMLGQQFEYEVRPILHGIPGPDLSIERSSRPASMDRFRYAHLIIKMMKVLPVLLAVATLACLALSWYFLIVDAITWGLTTAFAAIIFGGLLVVGVKLLVELRGVTHGFRDISLRD